MKVRMADVIGHSQMNRTETKRYEGVQTFMWMTEGNIVEVPFDKEHLLEFILAPSNLNCAYKSVMRNKGCGGIDGMSCEHLLSWFLTNKETLTRSLQDGSYRPDPVRRVEEGQRQDAPFGYTDGRRPAGAASHQSSTDPNL